MISNYRRLWAFAVVFCLLFLMGCADSDERIGEIDYSDYTVSLGRISHTGTMISYNEIAEFLDENQALLERVIALSCVEQVENPTVLNRAVCLLEVGEHSSIVNKAFVYLPVVDQKGTLIKLISLRRTENGLEYSIEELGVIGEALEKYPGEDLVLVQVPSHLAVCVIAPDNRIFSNFSTEMFDPRTDYYDHFKTEYNVINADWYNQNCISNNMNNVCSLVVAESVTDLAKESCRNYAQRITPYGSTIDAAKTLTGFPNVSQGNYGLCWAAAVSSIAKYVGSPYSAMTITEIADQMNIGYNTGATISQCRTALTNMIGSSHTATIKGRVLAVAEIQEEINAYDPVFLKLYVNVPLFGTQYHASVLVGYDISVEANIIKIMDSLVSSGYVLSTYNGTSWTYTVSGYTLTWMDSITIQN